MLRETRVPGRAGREFDRSSGRLDVCHPVGPERPPLVPGHVPGDEVPAATRVHEAVGVYVPDGGLAPPGPGTPGGCARPAADGGQFQQHAGRDLPLFGPGRLHERGVHLAQAGPRFEAVGPPQFQQRRQRGLVTAEDAAQRGLTQSDGHGERLLVVEDQRWHPGAAAQAVAAPRPRVGLDAVAELPQPGDVPPDRAVGDRHPLGQLAAGPRRPCGQQRDQSQQAGR